MNGCVHDYDHYDCGCGHDPCDDHDHHDMYDHGYGRGGRGCRGCRGGHGRDRCGRGYANVPCDLSGLCGRGYAHGRGGHRDVRVGVNGPYARYGD